MFGTEPGCRRDARGSGGAHSVDLDVPARELSFKIGTIVEPANLEEVPLHEADQVLDGALLLSAPRCAQLRSEAVVQRRLSEGLVPADDPTLAVQDYGLGVVEHGDQRHTAPGFEATEHAAHERLDGFTDDQAHVHTPRVLQARGEEADLLGGPVEVTHMDLSEVMLRELARYAFEAYKRCRLLRTQLLGQLVDRGL